MIRIKIALNILMSICTLLLLKAMFDKTTDNKNMILTLSFARKRQLRCTHSRSIYSIDSKPQMLIKSNNTFFPNIIEQEKIGLCINFNFNPDDNANTLRSLLMYYMLIHRYVIILTPSSFDDLSKANQALLHKLNVVVLTSIQTQQNQYVRLNVSQKVDGRLFHIHCIGTNRGFYQHICTSLCAQFIQHQHTYSSMRGLLYIPDDIFFNFTLVLTNPTYYNLDEFWMSPSTALVDATSGKQQPSKWYWWHVNNNWNRLHDIFFVQKVYSDVLSSLYGPNRLLVSALADILYIPVADNQMKTFINVTDSLMTYFPNAFCEIIVPIIVDITSGLCGHWPYQHDRTIFHSTINRLNNKTNIQELEKQRVVIGAWNPLNIKEYQRRPCLLNVNGSLWGAHRRSETLYKHMLFTGQSPFINETDDSQIDYLHPIKLSTNTTWQYQFWHEAMKIQLQRLYDLQLQCGDMH